MRLSDFSPRLNGIVPALTVPGLPTGVHGLGAYDLTGQITTYFNSFMNGLQFAVEQGNAATPAVVQETLTSAAINACADVSPTPCDPNSVSALISSYVAQYTAAYNSTVANTAYLIQSGQIVAPPTYVPAPNVLNTVAPNTTGVTTNQAGGNVLAPPVVTTPVTSTQVVNNQTQGGSVALANGTSITNTGPATYSWSWLTDPIPFVGIPMWVALAGGAVVLLMVMKKK
jgi:hypothetical protein